MTISKNVYSKISTLVKEQSGIQITEDKDYLIETRLIPILEKYGYRSLNELADSITPENENLMCEIIEALTTNESLFFRDIRVFDLFKDAVLSNILQYKNQDKEVRIWSAACSTGQEPNSISMSCLENVNFTRKFSILATDIDSIALQKAKTGKYSQFEVQRGVPVKLLLKYFEKEGQVWQIKSDVSKYIKYKQYNLIKPTDLGEEFDIIFCRNVLIYFDLDTKKKVINNILKYMHKGSFLFLGSSESLIGLDDLGLKLFDNNHGIYIKR